MTETQQRFLRVIAERVGAARVVELHLFPAIRQGGMESGVAVVAAVAERPAVSADADVPDESAVPGETVLPDESGAAAGAGAPAGADGAREDEVAAAQDVADEALVAGAVWVEAEVEDADAPPAPAHVHLDTVDATLLDDPELDDSPYAESPAAMPAEEVDALVSEATAITEEGERGEPSAHERLTVYSAHYRLAIKGPDRGKWVADVVAEADAPLDTVDAVVRGVQRRAGEVGEAERFTGDAFRAALESPVWTSRA